MSTSSSPVFQTEATFWPLRMAGLAALVNGVGFGAFDIPGTWHRARDHEVWHVDGNPTYGNGPFEAHGISVTVPVLLAFFGTCLVLAIGGALLLALRTNGVVVTLAGVLGCAPFWWGFDLPFAWFNAASILALLAMAGGAWMFTRPGLSPGRRPDPGDRPVHVPSAPVSAGWKPQPLLALGALGGLAWGCGLRGFMTQVTTDPSVVTWSGTFAWILVPSMVTGVLLGWAEHLRRATSAAGWRWLVLSPFVFSAVLVVDLVRHGSTLEGGIGGGALGVPAFGVIGAYAIGGRRPWLRATCGLVAMSAIPIWGLTATGIGGPALALDQPKGLWVALYYWTFLATLMIACSIPLRIAPGPWEPRERRLGAARS